MLSKYHLASFLLSSHCSSLRVQDGYWRSIQMSWDNVVEIAMLFVVGLSYYWSNCLVTITIASEIFPQEIRHKAIGSSLLGQTVYLLALTQPWPTFNSKVGAKSYWLLYGLNIVALVSRLATTSQTPLILYRSLLFYPARNGRYIA